VKFLGGYAVAGLVAGYWALNTAWPLAADSRSAQAAVLITAPGRYVDHTAAPAFVLYLGALVGLAGLIGSQRPGAGHRYTVARSTGLDRATELVLAPVGQPMSFRPGQFAFIEFHSPDLSETHPFSIASSPSSPELRFAVRTAGDWTRRVSTGTGIEEGLAVTVRGPYGRFTPGSGSAEQVWIAGGIGVTPFLSVLRGAPGDLPRATLLYAVRSGKEALFLDEIEYAAQQSGGRFRVIVLASD
jgi:predicted ferric reductase